MADSLIIADAIELLGGGEPSAIPECAGAVFRLVPGHDLGAPEPQTDLVVSMLLDGEILQGRRASNRTITLPIVIQAPDRWTLTAAREILLRTVDQQTWTLAWCRDGGQPAVFDSFRASATTNAYALTWERQLVSKITLEFQALPYCRSDVQTKVTMASPLAGETPPPSPVVLDDFATVSGTNWAQDTGHTGSYKSARWWPPAKGASPYHALDCTYSRGLAWAGFLSGDASTFEATIAHWVPALPVNCTVTRSTAQAHGGTASMALTASAAGDMHAGHCATADIATYGMGCKPGDVITAAGWARAATAARSVAMGVEFYDSAGASIGYTYGTAVTDSTSAWTSVTAAVTAPAGSFRCRARAMATSAAAAGEVHYFDDVTLGSGGYDLTGLTVMTCWLGLGWDNTTGNWNYWRGFDGRCQLSYTLTDAAGKTLAFSSYPHLPFSNDESAPRWSKVSVPIPAQNPAGDFDFTRVVAWSLNLSNWRSHMLYMSPRIDSVTASPPSVRAAAATRGDVYRLNVAGNARTPVSLQFQQTPTPSTTTATLPDTAGQWALWQVPAGVSVGKVEGIGGGGAGGSRTTTGQGGGGKGGGYARRDNAQMTAGNQLWYRTGKGGTAGATPTVSTPYLVLNEQLNVYGSSYQVTVDYATSSGDTVVVAVGSSHQRQASQVYDNRGNWYTYGVADNNVPKNSIWYCLDATPLQVGDKITVVLSGTTEVHGENVIAVACAGLLFQDLQVHKHFDDYDFPYASTSWLQHPQVVFGILAEGSGGGDPAWMNGFTEISKITTGNRLSVAYKKTASSGAQTAQAEIIWGAMSAMCVITFAAQTSGGGDVTDGTEGTFIAEDGTVTAPGGASVPANTATGATAAIGTASGDVTHTGGSGATGTSSGGGGGGSSGGESADGNPGAVPTGGAAPTGGGAGGNGGASGGNNAGTAGSVPGGAGGGAFSTGGTVAGGAGANGRWKVTYTSTAGDAFSTLIAHIPGPDAPPSLCPLVEIPTGDTPNGGTEYPVTSLVEGENAVFKGTYTIVLVGYTWNTPANARTVTVTVKQHEYSGGSTYSTSVARTFTPSTDVINGIAVIGELTLPLKAMAKDNTAATFGVTITDSNTSDRFQDCLALDTMGQTTMVNNPTAAAWRNLYLDEPAPDYALGRVLGSAYDRAQAVSVLDFCPIVSGGPIAAYPGDNTLLAYCVEGAPQIGAAYFPRWFMDRLP